MARRGPRPAVRIVRYAPARPTAPPGTRTTGTDGALALSPARTTPGSARPPNPLRLVRPDETAETELLARTEATVRIIVEVLAGTRPPHHLSRVAVPAVRRELERRPPRRGRVTPPRVLSCRVRRPAPGAAEAAAVVVVAGRFHAVALRLEPLRGEWRCTALETTALETTAREGTAP
ncbi:Rv3235 family protein [Actinomadura roseirufa]|uniref:Rv3235 family protein n=1 Tax=Actinomadura roseirufa TaxID=2094049 RepID=UPI001040EDAB|nr:Rv3235 family protein [Actinomadura roseirufa]